MTDQSPRKTLPIPVNAWTVAAIIVALFLIKATGENPAEYYGNLRWLTLIVAVVGAYEPFMKLPRVRPTMVGGIAELESLFASLGRYRGIPRDVVQGVFALAPEGLKASSCFLDRLTGLWRYDFGEPLDLPSGGVVVGTTMFQPVDVLYDVLSTAQRRLTPSQLSNYLIRLADPKKHDDFLFEFAPIVRLGENVGSTYEVMGFGDGNSTVDWLLRPEKGPPILLDVKNRTKDLLQSLTSVQEGDRSVDGSAPVPSHDANLLFASVEQKFRPKSPTEMVQAVWVGTDLKQEEKELTTAFSLLDPSKVHVAILGDWHDDAYVVTNDAIAKEHALATLGVRESRRFVFNRRDS